MKKPIKFGKYLLLERINIGGMAEVFKAKSFGVEGFEKMLAIKRILPNIAEDEEFITMFIDEAKIAVQLNHANIAQIYDLGKIEDSYFIALEFISGKDVRTIWDRHKKRGLLLPLPMSVYIMSRACEGLDYAHRKKDAGGNDLNIVHRDVSPQNVLISFEGEVKVIDFGIAKAANKASKTQAGILKGKFGYMSPEQVRGLPLDGRSDIFSAGIILYELLTGERLFMGESDFSTLEKVRNAEILPPTTYNGKIPDELEEIVLKALSKDPDDRYQQSYEMQEELQRFLIVNRTNFARKDLANYMKRAFKADIERILKRQTSYQDFTPEDVEDEEDDTASSQTIPGGPGVMGGPGRPKTPRPAAKPAPPPVLVGDEEDDAEIDTVVFDPRSAKADRKVSEFLASVAQEQPAPSPPRPAARPGGTGRRKPGRGQIGSGPRPRPAARRPAPPVEPEPLDDDDATVPGGMPRPPLDDRPTYDHHTEMESFGNGESTAAHDVPDARRGSRLNLIIVCLALVAVVVVGLAVFKFLQQAGLLGGGGALKIQVTPPDAKVFLDGKMVGDFSPNVIQDVKPGAHVIVAKRDNYQDHQEQTELESGEQREISIHMSYIPAGLELEVSPSDAVVKMDDRVIGEQSPVRRDDILPGEHEFTVERAGYQPHKVKWQFKPTETRKEKVSLTEILFALDVKSEPSKAIVFLDDVRKGRTPLPIKGLKGHKQYKLKLKHPRFPPWESTIRYNEGEPVQPIRVRLKPKARDAAPKPGLATAEPKPKPKPKPKKVAKGTGMLMLNSTPWGRVWIDDKDIGLSTPLINYKLPTGKHKITIHFSTGGTKTVFVHIKAGKKIKEIIRK